MQRVRFFPVRTPQGENLILRVSACVQLSVLMPLFCSAGAAGARLLSGQSKPTNMDVDEEENMSESTCLS